MLAHGEDVCFCCAEEVALRRNDVEVGAHSVHSGVAFHEVEFWVVALVVEREGEGEGVDDVLGGVHEAFLAGVDVEDALAFVAGEEGFDKVAFLEDLGLVGGVVPGGLGEGALSGDGVGVFVDVAVCVGEVGFGFDFGDDFDVGGDVDGDVGEFEGVEADEGCVIVMDLEALLEVWWKCAGKRKEDVWGYRRDDVLMLRLERDMCVAEVEWFGEEIEWLGD
jgi:hypothetical protein